MRSWLLVVFGMITSALIVMALLYSQKFTPPPNSLNSSNTNLATSTASPLSSPSLNPDLSVSGSSPQPQSSPSQTTSNLNPDLTVDTNGLSKATVIMGTTEGVIKFKFYSNEAPKTVKRMVELINKGFYNGLSFHRVVPGFVVQGGDPVGNGTGGSGQRLDAEFNSRHHLEGTLAMARAADPNSADSQFYIALGVLPHLDNNYTIFGQVTEGMDVVRKIKIGDKMTLVRIE